MGRLSWSVALQPIAGEREPGDAYCVVEDASGALIAVADGLGHGPYAAEAAQRAMAYVRNHADQSVEHLLEGCHKALTGTRGVVMALVRLEWRNATLVHTGLGNIETRIVAAGRNYRPVTVNGIVGNAARKLRTESFPFLPGDLLVMHSDGISDGFALGPNARDRDLERLAKQISSEHGRLHDDQLLLLARYA